MIRYNLKLFITKETIQIKLINEELKHEIDFKYNETDESTIYPLNIIFYDDTKKYRIFEREQAKENEIMINTFMEDIIDNPTEIKKYIIQFNQKEFELESETIFLLVFFKFLSVIQKNYIINMIEIEIPTTNRMVYKRLDYLFKTIGSFQIIINNETPFKKEINQIVEIFKFEKTQREFEKILNQIPEEIKKSKNISNLKTLEDIQKNLNTEEKTK